MAEMQTIPARYGTATFVPAGGIIKIINTSGTQVVDTWAFALPRPDGEKGETGPEEAAAKKAEAETQKQEAQKSPRTPKKSKKSDFPDQEEAEKATREGINKEGESPEETEKKQNSGWSGYIPSVPSVPTLGFGGKKGDESVDAASKKDQQQKDSKTWSSYFAAGKGFSSYIPKQASDTVTQFAGYHERDTSKSYMQQLQDFSKTPVGAAGMAAISGSGYGSSLYAGYSAWNAKNAANGPAMEFLSMAHSRASTLHLVPQVNDTLVTNLREPILTLVEDTSSGVHDTLIAACDPIRYKQLGAEDWEQHGSCAENLVLALKELNERAGLKGAKAVGAEVSINSVPAPLNLFMNIPWGNDGDLDFAKPKSKKGGFVRFKAERDVVVVMSACPQDLLDINNKEITDANFILEDGEAAAQALKRTQAKSKSTPRKPPPSKAPAARQKSSEAAAPTPAKKKPVPSKKPTQTSQPAKAAPAAQKKPPPKLAQSDAQSDAQSTPASQPARKKPIPPAAKASANGEASAPVERKKPRKLVRQPANSE